MQRDLGTDWKADINAASTYYTLHLYISYNGTCNEESLFELKLYYLISLSLSLSTLELTLENPSCTFCFLYMKIQIFFSMKSWKPFPDVLNPAVWNKFAFMGCVKHPVSYSALGI